MDEFLYGAKIARNSEVFHSLIRRMSNDISKQIQSINKQLASVGPAVQVGNYLGVSPFAGVVAVLLGLLVAFMLFLDVLTGFI
jgi:hypothetical protein